MNPHPAGDALMADPTASTATFESRMARPPLVLNNRSMAWISDRIAGIVENKAPLWWWVAIAITGSFAAFGIFCILYLLFTGVDVWGNNIPVGWAWGTPTSYSGSVSVTPEP